MLPRRHKLPSQMCLETETQKPLKKHGVNTSRIDQTSTIAILMNRKIGSETIGAESHGSAKELETAKDTFMDIQELKESDGAEAQLLAH